MRRQKLVSILSLTLAVLMLTLLAGASAQHGTEAAANGENEALALITEKPLTIASGRTYYISITEADLLNAAESIYVMTYDSGKLELTDFAAQTGKLTIAEGDVSGANVTILSHEDGKLYFKVTTDGTAVATVVQFEALLDGNTVVTLGAEKNTRTVTGFVSPFVLDDLEQGPAFLAGFDITVELRAAFSTPAPDSLKTTAVFASEFSNGITGKFSIENVPFGEYVLYISRPGYLTRCLQVSVSNEDADVVLLTPPENHDAFNLIWGDVNGDWIVDGSDLSLISTRINVMYGEARYLSSADLNADGFIDGSDFALASGKINYTILDYPGAETVNYEQ